MIRWTEDGRYFKAADATFADEVEIGREEFEARVGYFQRTGQALPLSWTTGQPVDVGA